MALRLILVRHAKSDWTDPVGSDHARVLNPRGRKAAVRMGKWLAAQGVTPGEALVSTAARTRETWALMAPELPGAPEPRFLDALYHAGPDVMLRALQTAEADTVLMLGHNPGIAAFARWLLDEPPKHGRFADYPTCATLIARFDVADWGGVGPARGVAEAFAIPRELPAED